MVNYKVATTTRRYLNLVRRAIEAVVVLSLAFVTTILTLCFGWVALLFKSAPATARPAKAVGLPAVSTSKEY